MTVSDMEIKSLKLYHFPGSRSARVRWALLETVGSEFELETMKLLEGVQYAPEFLAINPNHAVPVLAITWDSGDTQYMLESTAIVEWLAENFAQKQLAPPADALRERADYLQMLQFGGSWMDAMLWQLRLHRDLLPDDQADPKTLSRTLAKFRDEVEPQLIARLDHQAFICGENFSAADILIGHNVFWAKLYGLCEHELLTAYLHTLAKRPAFQQAFDDVSGKFLPS